MKKTSVLVVAETAKLDRSKELAGYNCSKCSNMTVVQASVEEPFCAHCGDAGLTATEHSSIRGRSLMRSSEEELCNVRCPGCSSHVIMTIATAKDHSEAGVGHLHCVACSTEIAFASPETASDDDWEETDDNSTDLEADAESGDEDEDEDGEKPEMPKVVVKGGDGATIVEGTLSERDDMVFVIDTDSSDDVVLQVFTVGSTDDIVEGEDGTITLSNAEIVEQLSDEELNDLEADKEDASVDEETPPAAEVPSEEANADDKPADALPEEANAEEAPPAPVIDAPVVTQEAPPPAVVETPEAIVPQVTSEPVTVPLYAVASAADPVFETHGDMTVCRQGDVITAYRLNEDMESASFVQALNTAASSGNSLEAIFTQNDFVIASIELTEDAHVAERVRKEQEAVTQTVTAKLDDTGVVLKQSLGIALTGLNRGFFRQDNPLMTTMIAALETEGIETAKARSIVYESFARAGDEFANVVRDQTLAAYNKSDETRNELASTILDVQIAPETAALGNKNRRSPVESELTVPFKRSGVVENASVDEPNPNGNSRVLQLARKSAMFGHSN